MKQKILLYLKHISVTVLILVIAAIIFGLSIGAALNYHQNPARLNLNNEGPYLFFNNDSTLLVNYIRGNRDDGFYTDRQIHNTHNTITARSFFPLDSTSFEFTISMDIESPPVIYSDTQPILAISDIEGSYRSFRNFLTAHKVIDKDLNWIFGKGHLVLLGDFVDRGWSVTQVLWFIYKMEQEAHAQGGTVHYILGNHELKNMQGMYHSAAERYYAVAAALGKQHHNLYDTTSFIGRWLRSKNSIERINGHLFVHGGLHPDLADKNISLEEMNAISRKNYSHVYFPKPEETTEQLLISTTKGISWYRGYFKDDLSQEEIDRTLDYFKAQVVVVGHTLQSKVTPLFNGRVIGIDVKHPRDYIKIWPKPRSEGLLIQNKTKYRLLDDGSKKELQL